MKASEFVERAKLAAASKTVYAFGQFGLSISDGIRMGSIPYSNMTAVRSGESTRSYALRYSSTIRKPVKNAAEGTFGFDCSGLIQACLCEWNANKKDYLGGADPKKCDTRYTANVLAHMTGWTSGAMTAEDWACIRPGDVMFQAPDSKNANHIAIYIGDGKAIECAYDWCGPAYGMTDGVQTIDLCGYSNGYMYTNRNGCSGKRKWIGFGSLPMIEYEEPCETEIIFWNNEDDPMIEEAKQIREALAKIIERLDNLIE